MKRTLGTCYYPEHWSRDVWEDDARRMAEAGLTWIRIGEFAWSRLEPTPGQYDFDWLDEVIEILGAAGLKVVLGTPTAAPPRWVVDRHPDMLPVDEQGRTLRFGSRRHYCFSHEGFKQECATITEKLAARYGNNPVVAAWQTDNEYGCNDTTYSYGETALIAFRNWLRERYVTIDELNSAWGNVFWSMEYNDFDQIDLPNLTVAEVNPSHIFDFRKFSSDQVVAFNKLQVDIIRAHSNAPIAHNYMGKTTEFDHFDVGEELDFASWDSYPLGFLEDRLNEPSEYVRAFARQGEPDFQAFHHDLYRSVGKGRWWIMEQQPGPVNWAPYNPAPLPGMVRLWTWEAFAHGAEAVCYFRWRQAPIAQELMHAGLLRPDSADAPALSEAAQVAREIADAPVVSNVKAKVALVFDYQSDWAWSIHPHGEGLEYFTLVFEHYRVLRSLGISLDIVSKDADFSQYSLIVAPGLTHMSERFRNSIETSEGQVVLGPRGGAKDANMNTPVPLPPSVKGLDITVARTESLRPDMPIELEQGGNISGYFEHLEGTATAIFNTKDGSAAVVEENNLLYVAGWLDKAAMKNLLTVACAKASIPVKDLPDGLRCRETDTEEFWFNYSAEEITYDGRAYPPCSVTRT